MDLKKAHLNNPDCQGWLTKQGEKVKNWKRRWFVLKHNAVFYFNSDKGVQPSKALGIIDLKHAECYVNSEKDMIIAIATIERLYLAKCDNANDMKMWLTALNPPKEEPTSPPAHRDRESLVTTMSPPPQPQSPQPQQPQSPQPQPQAPQTPEKQQPQQQAAPATPTSPQQAPYAAYPQTPTTPAPGQAPAPTQTSAQQVPTTAQAPGQPTAPAPTPAPTPAPAALVEQPTTEPEDNNDSKALLSRPRREASAMLMSGAAAGTGAGWQTSAANTNTNNESNNTQQQAEKSPETMLVRSTTVPTFAGTAKHDVQVRVHIIEARELKGRDSNGQSDPICFVKMFDKEKHTVIHKKTTSCTWDHLFIFHLKLFNEELMSGKINLEVYNANTIFRNDLIGSHTIDMARVYNSPGHEMYRVWMALVDTSREFSGVQGYLKASMTVLRGNDVPPSHTDDDDDESEYTGDSLQKMVLLPPTIKTEEHHLVIRTYKGENVPKLNLLTKPDPFIEVQFAGIKMKTTPSKSTQSPVWNEELKLPVTLPTLSDTITLTLMDSNTGRSDDIISTRFLKFTDIMGEPGQRTKPFWINFYGSPYFNLTANQTDQNMNKGLIDPTAFRGRVLVDISVEKSYDPKPIKNQTTPVTSDDDPQMYVLRFDLYEGLELRMPPARGLEKIEVEIVWGNQRVASPVVAAQKANNSSITTNKRLAFWYDSLPELRQQIRGKSLPDVFLNVYSVSIVGERTRIGVLRYKSSELSINTPPGWIALNPDMSLENEITKLMSPKSSFGFLLCKLTLGLGTEMAMFPRPPIRRPTTSRFVVRCYIYQGRDLPAADATGLSDPYLVVKVGPETAESSTKLETLSPQWYEVLDIPCELPDDLLLAPEINITVWDYNKIQQHSKLGRFHVPIYGLSVKPSPLTWYPISDTDGAEGAILACFQLIPGEVYNRYPATNIVPQYKMCNLEISLVGLRGLLPFALLPIENAFVEFDLGDDPTINKRIIRSSVCALPSGDNPNHLESVVVQTRLPVQPIFAPSLTIRVYDRRVINAPLIGAASLNLAKYLPWAKEILANPDNDEILQPAMRPTRFKNIEIGRRNSAVIVTKEKEKEKEDKRESQIIPALPPPPKFMQDVNGTGSQKGFNMDNVLSYDNSNNNNNNDANINGDDTPALVPSGADQSTDTLIDVDQAASEATVRDSEIIDGDGSVVVEEKEDEPPPSRPTLTGTLEEEVEPAFEEINLIRGKKKGLNFFERLTAKLAGPLQLNAGKFKGSCHVYEGEQHAATDLRKLYTPKPYVVRIYILQGTNLVPKDLNGSSDPYITISLGKDAKHNVNERDKHIKKNLNPQFFKFFEMPVTLPGNSELKVSIWDYNLIGGDELIGTTMIDLENRIFSNKWKDLPINPIEWRPLWHPSSSNPQGQLALWIDIMTPEQAACTPPVPIGPPVLKGYELRVVVWETKDVVMKDNGMSDVYLVGHVEGQSKQNTDTHWRCDDGNAKFNWRFVYNMEMPNKLPRFKIQMWDKDILTPNGVIAEAVLNLKGFMQKAYKSREGVHEWAIPKQYISMYHPNFDGVQGKVELQVDLLTLEEASKKPAGKGREEPNDHPFLAMPDRPDTSFNPFRVDKYIAKVFFRKHKGKIIGCCACMLIVVLLPVIYFLLSTVFKLVPSI